MSARSWVVGNERISALFDGACAIAITMLVLELKIPVIDGAPTEASIHAALAEQIPEAVAWVISFVLIARVWQEQHLVWAHTTRSDIPTILLTISLLAAVTLIPFGSSLVGKYPEEPISVLIFSGVMVASGLILSALTGYTARQVHLHGERGPGVMSHKSVYLAATFPLVGVIAVLLAYLNHPLVGIAGWLAEPVVTIAYWRKKGGQSGGGGLQ